MAADLRFKRPGMATLRAPGMRERGDLSIKVYMKNQQYMPPTDPRVMLQVICTEGYFYVHKALAVVNSPMLKDFLSEDKEDTPVLSLADIDVRIAEKLFRCIYQGYTIVTGFEEQQKVEALALALDFRQFTCTKATREEISKSSALIFCLETPVFEVPTMEVPVTDNQQHRQQTTASNSRPQQQAAVDPSAVHPVPHLQSRRMSYGYFVTQLAERVQLKDRAARRDNQLLPPTINQSIASTPRSVSEPQIRSFSTGALDYFGQRERELQRERLRESEQHENQNDNNDDHDMGGESSQSQRQGQGPSRGVSQNQNSDGGESSRKRKRDDQPTFTKTVHQPLAGKVPRVDRPAQPQPLPEPKQSTSKDGQNQNQSDSRPDKKKKKKEPEFQKIPPNIVIPPDRIPRKTPLPKPKQVEKLLPVRCSPRTAAKKQQTQQQQHHQKKEPQPSTSRQAYGGGAAGTGTTTSAGVVTRNAANKNDDEKKPIATKIETKNYTTRLLDDSSDESIGDFVEDTVECEFCGRAEWTYEDLIDHLQDCSPHMNITLRGLTERVCPICGNPLNKSIGTRSYLRHINRCFAMIPSDDDDSEPHDNRANDNGRNNAAQGTKDSGNSAKKSSDGDKKTHNSSKKNAGDTAKNASDVAKAKNTEITAKKSTDVKKGSATKSGAEPVKKKDNHSTNNITVSADTATITKSGTPAKKSTADANSNPASGTKNSANDNEKAVDGKRNPSQSTGTKKHAADTSAVKISVGASSQSTVPKKTSARPKQKRNLRNVQPSTAEALLANAHAKAMSESSDVFPSSPLEMVELPRLTVCIGGSLLHVQEKLQKYNMKLPARILSAALRLPRESMPGTGNKQLNSSASVPATNKILKKKVAVSGDKTEGTEPIQGPSSGVPKALKKPHALSKSKGKKSSKHGKKNKRPKVGPFSVFGGEGLGDPRKGKSGKIKNPAKDAATFIKPATAGPSSAAPATPSPDDALFKKPGPACVKKRRAVPKPVVATTNGASASAVPPPHSTAVTPPTKPAQNQGVETSNTTPASHGTPNSASESNKTPEPASSKTPNSTPASSKRPNSALESNKTPNSTPTSNKIPNPTASAHPTSSPVSAPTPAKRPAQILSVTHVSSSGTTVTVKRIGPDQSVILNHLPVTLPVSPSKPPGGMPSDINMVRVSSINLSPNSKAEIKEIKVGTSLTPEKKTPNRELGKAAAATTTRLSMNREPSASNSCSGKSPTPTAMVAKLKPSTISRPMPKSKKDAALARAKGNTTNFGPGLKQADTKASGKASTSGSKQADIKPSTRSGNASNSGLRRVEIKTKTARGVQPAPSNKDQPKFQTRYSTRMAEMRQRAVEKNEAEARKQAPAQTKGQQSEHTKSTTHRTNTDTEGQAASRANARINTNREVETPASTARMAAHAPTTSAQGTESSESGMMAYDDDNASTSILDSGIISRIEIINVRSLAPEMQVTEPAEPEPSSSDHTQPSPSKISSSTQLSASTPSSPGQLATSSSKPGMTAAAAVSSNAMNSNLETSAAAVSANATNSNPETSPAAAAASANSNTNPAANASSRDKNSPSSSRRAAELAAQLEVVRRAHEGVRSRRAAVEAVVDAKAQARKKKIANIVKTIDKAAMRWPLMLTSSRKVSASAQGAPLPNSKSNGVGADAVAITVSGKVPLAVEGLTGNDGSQSSVEGQGQSSSRTSLSLKPSPSKVKATEAKTTPPENQPDGSGFRGPVAPVPLAKAANAEKEPQSASKLSIETVEIMPISRNAHNGLVETAEVVDADRADNEDEASFELFLQDPESPNEDSSVDPLAIDTDANNNIENGENGENGEEGGENNNYRGNNVAVVGPLEPRAGSSRSLGNGADTSLLARSRSRVPVPPSFGDAPRYDRVVNGDGRTTYKCCDCSMSYETLDSFEDHICC